MSLHHDVIIVGGGASGLSAALMLGLARRSVVVIDNGQPRNAVAPISHGLLSRDGVPPGEIASAAREQLKPYPHVELIGDTVNHVESQGWLLVCETVGGQVFRGRKMILATGLLDTLPPTPGLAECWGKSIFPCPYCHAWEYRDQPLALIGNGAGVHRTIAVMRSWSKDVALLTNGPPQIDYNERMLLHHNKVPLYDLPIASYEQIGGQVMKVIFEGGTFLSRRGILYHPPTMQRTDLPIHLGLIKDGRFAINPQTAQTSNPNIYVAGDMVGQFQPMILPSAVYSGAFTARQVHQALAIEDFTATVH